MEEALCGPHFWTALNPYLGDEALPTEWILNHAPGVYELAVDSSNFPGTVNLGLFSLVLARARLRAHGDSILQVHPALHEQLLETDLGAKLPVGLFRLPYTAAFIEFGRPSALSIFNPASGGHEVEGAYVGSYQVGPHSFIFAKDDRRQHLGLDPEKPTRIIEIVLTGSPRGKANALDDASQNVALFLQDGDADLETAIEQHFAFYRLPYTAAFIEFGRPSGLSIFNPASGEHEVEGAYVGSYQVGPHSFIFEKDDRRRHLGLDPNKSTRIIEIVLTGSPRGKANALDDASQNVALFLQGGDADLGTAIERHFAFYRLPSAGSLPGFVPPDERERASFERAVYQLAKVMLYLNLPEAEQVRRPDRSELLQRLRGLGPKKAARLQRKLARTYDRIVIGGRREAEDSTSGPADHAPGSVRPHWRRGHFRRIRFGEGLAESRLGWIRPLLVNAAEAFGAVQVKGYEVR